MKKEMPYMPEGREIKHVSLDDPYMVMAKQVAERESLDPGHRTGAVIVMNDRVVAAGANGSKHHKIHGCKRKELGIPTGEGYDLCEGCSPVNHAEQSAIKVWNGYNRYNNLTLDGAALYLWGHWWCCESCWDAMIKAGIKDVYLPIND